MFILRIVVTLLSIAFMVLVCRQVSNGKLLLRYSLLWLTLAIVTILVSLFPDPMYRFAEIMGFNTPSNFVFFAALFFLLVICLSLSVVVSRQALRIKDLVQNMALLEKEIWTSQNHAGHYADKEKDGVRGA